MSWVKAVKLTQSSLEKASDVKYFLVLTTFLFFLDFCLIVFKSQPLVLLKLDTVKAINIGEILIFLTLFSFFLSFFVSFIQYMLQFTAAIIPARWYQISNSKNHYTRNSEDFISLSELERIAVITNNSNAYQLYDKQNKGLEKINQLCYFCLAFLLASLCNYYASKLDPNSLWAIIDSAYSNETISGKAISLVLLCLYGMCTYLGVIVGGNFTFPFSSDVYLREHKLSQDSSFEKDSKQ